ncbi:MAG: HEPN domain-containing protein [Candidatus Tectomicrobia bacterium]|nr:HEPN domain-containing protein [Candidatus Tectomicrobia bacterium]
MPHDPELVAETRAWVARAEDDLRAGAIVLSAEPPLTAAVVFHAQQAAEKAMKGFLTWHSRPFRKTYNLTEIGGMCVGRDASLEPLLRRAAMLTDYAWKFRYPGEPEYPPREEAEEALDTAREVFDAILARLPEEVRP